MDAVAEGIMVVDAGGTIRDVNPSAAALFGPSGVSTSSFAPSTGALLR